MKKLSIIFLSFIMVISSVVPTFSAFAEDSIVTPMSVKFYSGDSELSVIEDGAITPKIVLNAKTAGDKIDFYYAMYDSSDNTLLTLVPYTHTLTLGTNTIESIPSITVSGAETKALKLFAWGTDIAPADKYKCLGTVAAEGIGSLSFEDSAGTHTATPDSKDNIKFTTEYVKGSYTNTTYPTTITPTAANGTYKTADGETTIDLTDGETVILSDDNGATRDYTVSADNKILNWATDFDGYAIGSDLPTSDSGTFHDDGKLTKYDSEINTSGDIVARPDDNSDTASDNDNHCLKINWLDKGTGRGGYVYSYGNNRHPVFYDTMELTFDFRLDDNGTTAQAVAISQGVTPDSSDDYGNNLLLVFGTGTGASWWSGGDFAADEYGVALSKRLAKACATAKTDDGSFFKMKLKKWYTIKYVSRVNRSTNEWFVDIYVDDMGTPVLTYEDTHTVKPFGIISRYSPDSKQKSAYNFFYKMNSTEGCIAYLDNIKEEYSYNSEGTDLFIIGDSIVAEYYATSSQPTQQGWGKYFVSKYIDTSKITPHNLAYPGHRAEWVVDGVPTDGTDAQKKEYDADWQHIKGQVGKGDYVIISIGLNDTSYSAYENVLVENLTTIGNEAIARGAKVIYVTVPPSSTVTDGKYTARQSVNNKMSTARNNVAGSALIGLSSEIVDKLNAEVAASSTTDEVTAKYYKSGDVTHFNETGAEFVADTLADLIEASEATDLDKYFK